MKNDYLKIAKEYLLITIGLFLYCWSWTSFLIPNGISGGGVTGLATVIQYATNGFVPVSLSYLLINVCLVTMGTLALGKGFGFKTIYCILLASVMLKVLPDLIPWYSDIEEPFINALLGGAIGGVGICMIFLQGGSTGGTDIIALIIGKYREISPGTVFMWCDLMIIGSIMFLPEKGLQDVVYGYIQMVSFTYTLDMLLTGNKQSVQILIFSSKYKEIADILVHQKDKGVTALSATGWYSQCESKVLLVVVRKYGLNEVMKTIKEIDERAFTSVSQVQSVYGRGFDQIKAGGKIKWNKESKEC
ncbi:MAG: YitT family protein [Bacteroidales bacterium]|nr:YitT family protein [Bacteroidales bacterium]MBO7763536.1 YitT family protein [Bacteroidales bacterium]MBQ2244132.1 YitT family protein [Bacteroidales bacterium]